MTHKTIISSIPAHPGWFVLEPICDDDGIYRYLIEESIIGWYIHIESHEDCVAPLTITYPIITSGIPEGEIILKDQGGRIFIVEGGEFYSLSSLLDYLNRAIQ